MIFPHALAWVKNQKDILFIILQYKGNTFGLEVGNIQYLAFSRWILRLQLSSEWTSLWSGQSDTPMSLTASIVSKDTETEPVLQGCNLKGTSMASCDWHTFSYTGSGLSACCTSLLTSLRPLLGCWLDAGQANVFWLILYKHQANKGEGCTENAGHGQDSPPVVVLQKHGDQKWTQTAGQVHTAGQHGPPCSKLGGLIPLMEQKREQAENSHYIKSHNAGRVNERPLFMCIFDSGSRQLL